MAYDYYDQWQESKMPLSQYHSSGSYTVQRAAYEGGWGAISAGTGSAIASTSLKIGAKALTSGAIETGYEYAKKSIANEKIQDSDWAAAALGGYFGQHFSELTEKTVKAVAPRFTSTITSVGYTNNFTWRGRTPSITGNSQETWRYQLGVSTGTLIDSHFKSYVKDKLETMRSH